MAVLALCALLPACVIVEGVHDDPDFYVDNQRDYVVTVTIDGIPTDARNRQLFAGPQRETGFEMPQCRGTGAVATDPDGVELARLDEPVCAYLRWVFAADGTVLLERLPTYR